MNVRLVVICVFRIMTQTVRYDQNIQKSIVFEYLTGEKIVFSNVNKLNFESKSDLNYFEL